jgi:hypothetical protein
MTKMPPPSEHADEVRALIISKRRREAKSRAAELLRAGVLEHAFIQIVADLLNGQRGRPRMGRLDRLPVKEDYDACMPRGTVTTSRRNI